MSNALFLGPASAFDAGDGGCTVTLTPTGSTSLVGTGGCYFQQTGTSINEYVNWLGTVTVSVSGSANEFVAVFGANTTGGTATGTVTLSNAISTDVQIGNLDETVTVVPAGQTTGSFSIPLPVGGTDLAPRKARERFQANAAKTPAAAAR